MEVTNLGIIEFYEFCTVSKFSHTLDVFAVRWLGETPSKLDIDSVHSDCNLTRLEESEVFCR